jgi:hypothetical protein
LFSGDTNDITPLLIWGCRRLGIGDAIPTAPCIGEK